MPENLFKTLSRNGYTPVPILPEGKAPGAYDFELDRWAPMQRWQSYLDHPAPQSLLDTWSYWYPEDAPRIGVLTGDLVAVDIDATDRLLAEYAIELAYQTLGTSPFHRIGKAPKTMLFYRADKRLRKIMSKSFTVNGQDKQRVEILGEGQQCVLIGEHPETGKPYTQPGLKLQDYKLSELPVVTEEQLRTFIRKFEDAAQTIFDGAAQGATINEGPERISNAQGDINGEVVSAMASLPQHLADDYHSWVRIGMALKGALPDDEATASTLWHEFSAKSPKYDADQAQRKWDTFAPGRIGAGTLYRLARQEGNWTSTVASPQADFDGLEFLQPDGDKVVGSKKQKPKLFFERFDEIKESLQYTNLVENLIDAGAMSVLYGDSNTGKTFVAMDIAFHIATGQPWDNKRTTQGPVVYVAAEGGSSARNRIAALKQHYSTEKAPFYLVPCPVDLLRTDADTKPLIEMIAQIAKEQARPISLIVIDTLSRALAGGNENDSKELGSFVRNIDLIRTTSNAHLMIVHHSGKDKAKGARGHSLLRAATDTEIEIADKTISATKQRDMEISKPMAFNLKVVELGLNAYNKPVTSCVVQMVDFAQRIIEQNNSLSARDQSALIAFHDALAASDTIGSNNKPVVNKKVWMAHLKNFDITRVLGCPRWPDSVPTFSRTFKEARERLLSLGYVTELRPDIYQIGDGLPIGNSDFNANNMPNISD